jgi:hypothetical protein
VLDLRLDQKIDWCQRVLALMHALAGSGDTMEAWCTACCTYLLQSSVDEFRSQDFGLKLNWEAPCRTCCILFCLPMER